MDYTKAIREYIDLEKEVISKLDVDAINDAMNLIMKAYEANKKIYIFGNGGSSATASLKVEEIFLFPAKRNTCASSLLPLD